MSIASSTATSPYEALLICSFGGPNRPDDVMPFLRNVTVDKGIPDERLAEVAEHYHRFGGKSPINEQNLALQAALTNELRARGSAVPVLWSNRNWHPYTVDVLRDAVAFGARRILVLVTSAYASYSGSRQYREHLAAALVELDVPDVHLDVLRPFFNDPGFVDANHAQIRAAIEQLELDDAGVHIAYVTHSIPDTMQRASARTGAGYAEQHEDLRRTLAGALTTELGVPIASSLSYCSRSGDPRVPWLEPDIGDQLEHLATEGVRNVVIAPIGFISDHMEVAFDLDVEAMEAAEEHGVHTARAGTVGTHPAFIRGLADLVFERAARERGEDVIPVVRGDLPAFPDQQPAGSCRMRDGEVTGHPVIAGTED